MTLILAIVPVLLLIVLMAFFKMLSFCNRRSRLLLPVRSVESGFSYSDYHRDGYFQL